MHGDTITCSATIWFREEGFVKYTEAASPEVVEYPTNRLFSLGAYQQLHQNKYLIIHVRLTTTDYNVI